MDKFRYFGYRCYNRYQGSRTCHNRNIREDVVKSEFVKAVNEMLKKKKYVIEELERMLELLDNNKLIQDLSLKKQELKELGDKIDRLVNSNKLKLTDQNEYQEEYNKLSSEYNKLRDESIAIEEAIEHNNYDKVRLETEIKSYHSAGFIKEFSEELWLQLLDKAVVYGDKLTFVWKK